MRTVGPVCSLGVLPLASLADLRTCPRIAAELEPRHPAKWPPGSGARPSPMEAVLRKEVIQPQVPLRLPCYDFTPVAEPTVAGCPLLRGWRTVFG